MQMIAQLDPSLCLVPNSNLFFLDPELEPVWSYNDYDTRWDRELHLNRYVIIWTKSVLKIRDTKPKRFKTTYFGHQFFWSAMQWENNKLQGGLRGACRKSLLLSRISGVPHLSRILLVTWIELFCLSRIRYSQISKMHWLANNLDKAHSFLPCVSGALGSGQYGMDSTLDQRIPKKELIV